MRGAVSVINNLELELPPSEPTPTWPELPSDSLRWNKLVPHELISVVLPPAVVSWSESEEVARAAWGARRVYEVQNDLMVIPLGTDGDNIMLTGNVR